MPDNTTGVTGALTDGTGVSQMTSQKVIKDFVLDFMLTAAAALGAGATFDAFDLSAVIGAPEAALIAVGGALFRTAFRAIVRWASSP